MLFCPIKYSFVLALCLINLSSVWTSHFCIIKHSVWSIFHEFELCSGTCPNFMLCPYHNCFNVQLKQGPKSLSSIVLRNNVTFSTINEINLYNVSVCHNFCYAHKTLCVHVHIQLYCKLCTMNFYDGQRMVHVSLLIH